MPPRPLMPSRLLRHVCAMAAKRTWFSPAGPMASTSVPPSVSVMVSHVSRIHFPFKWLASLNATPSSVSIEVDEGIGLSVEDDRVEPGALERDGQAPPKVESKKSPVSGLMAAAHARLALGTAESV